MSRLEQDMIQAKLKAAIQSHQTLVVKLKGDNQNASFKKRLAELQDEIKRLSEEHKKLVVKVRENLMRSISQAQTTTTQQQAITPVANVGPTITAIGQPRLVSFPAQGGATILPMGMVAVPIAHMQKPTGAVTLQPTGMSTLSQPTNISLIPAGLINNFTLNPSGALTLGNSLGNLSPFCGVGVGQGVYANGFANPVNAPVVSAMISVPSSGVTTIASGVTSSTVSGSVVSTICATSGSVSNVTSNSSNAAVASSLGAISSSGINLNNFTNMTNLIINNSIGSNHPLVCNSKAACKTSVQNSITNNISSSSSVNNRCSGTGSIMVNSSGSSKIITDSSCALTNPSISVNNVDSNSAGSFLVCPLPLPQGGSAVTLPSSSSSSTFSQQPLVQPQLLQQQQQQIIQLIQQQQQQPPQLTPAVPPPPPPPPPPSAPAPQQRLASHLPIKVPQYTASLMRPGVSSTTSVQCYTIAPAPSLSGSLPASKVGMTTAPSTLKTTSTSSETPPIASLDVKPQAVSNGHHVGKEVKETSGKLVSTKQQLKSTQHRQQKLAKGKTSQQLKEKESPKQSGSDGISVEEKEKLKFMQVLDLYTPTALREILLKRTERKRRTTANPNYSIGFEISRRIRNGSVWTNISNKKAKTKGDTSWLGGCSDSTAVSLHQQWVSSKMNKQSDNHEDFCAACSKGGSLLMCSTCRLVYHLDCLNPPLTEAPKYAWSCPQCLVSGKGLVHLTGDALKRMNSYIDKRADKEDEKKKLQKRSKELKAEKSFLEKRNQELNGKIKEQEDVQSQLSEEEQRVQEDLSKLSDFVNLIRESRSGESQNTASSNVLTAQCS